MERLAVPLSDRHTQRKTAGLYLRVKENMGQDSNQNFEPRTRFGFNLFCCSFRRRCS